MPDAWRVAVIDSGVAARAGAGPPAWTVADASRFRDDGRQVVTEATVSDPIGHGTAVTEVIASTGSPVEFLIAQVLDERGRTTPAAVAAALRWSLESGAGLIHMSLGLRDDRHVLAAAIAATVSAGCVVIASAPARGPCTFPASYPKVIRATGDARCNPDEISALGSVQADFGGCPRLGGASLGAAHVTGFIVKHVAPGSEAVRVRSQLIAMARYRGAERVANYIPRSASSASTSPCSPTAFVVSPGIAGPKPLPDG